MTMEAMCQERSVVFHSAWDITPVQTAAFDKAAVLALESQCQQPAWLNFMVSMYLILAWLS